MRHALPIALLTVLAGAPVRADEPAAKPVTVPIEMLEKGRFFSGHFTVQVKVNGKGPYRLIFDTGAPIVLLSTRIARDADLTKAGARRPGPAGLAMPGQVSVASLEVGGLKVADVDAVVMDHPTVKMVADTFGPIDGIIGFPVFARYRTAVDYQAKQLTFTPNGFKPPDVFQALMTALVGRGRDTNSPPTVLAPAGQWGLRVEKDEDDDAPGVTVAEMLRESAAARAGIRHGDRLLTVDGRWTDSIADCFRAAGAVKPGRAVEVIVRRGGDEVKLMVTPANGL